MTMSHIKYKELLTVHKCTVVTAVCAVGFNVFCAVCLNIFYIHNK